MKSMTGYGSAEGKVGKGRMYFEIKSINHRYCEVSFRLPPRMGSLESYLRDCIQSRLKRGKIDIFIKETRPVFGPQTLTLNVESAKEYQSAIRRLQKALNLPVKADPITLMGIDSFVRMQEREENYAVHWKGIRKIVEEGLKTLERMRVTEGLHLLADQKKRLKSLDGLLRKTESRAVQNARERRSALVLKPANGSLEPNMTTDRMDTTEEVIRLKSHVRQYDKLLQSKEPVGRKLDFLIQEMHREINTIGAKAGDADISSYVVEAKSLLENLREQIQNIE